MSQTGAVKFDHWEKQITRTSYALSIPKMHIGIDIIKRGVKNLKALLKYSHFFISDRKSQAFSYDLFTGIYSEN